MATRLPQYAAKRPYRSLHFIALYLHHPVVSFVPSLALDLGCNGIGQRCRNRARARRKPKQMDIVKADPFDEEDALISVKGAPLFISYNPAQVLKLAGKRYLTGPVIFYRTDGHSTIVSLTVEDIYRFQTYLESHSTTLMADGQKLTCICID